MFCFQTLAIAGTAEMALGSGLSPQRLGAAVSRKDQCPSVRSGLGSFQGRHGVPPADRWYLLGRNGALREYNGVTIAGPPIAGAGVNFVPTLDKPRQHCLHECLLKGRGYLRSRWGRGGQDRPTDNLQDGVNASRRSKMRHGSSLPNLHFGVCSLISVLRPSTKESFFPASEFTRVHRSCTIASQLRQLLIDVSQYYVL